MIKRSLLRVLRKARRSLLPSILLAGCSTPDPAPEHALLPLPVSVTIDLSDTLSLEPGTRVVFDAGDGEAERIGIFLSDLIGNSDETRPAVMSDSAAIPEVSEGMGAIRLTRTGADASLGPEGYEIVVTATEATVRAPEAAGLFYGVQTLRQLMPPGVEYTAALRTPLFLTGVRIKDAPRFQWRGAMVDVARHFLPPADVKRFIDLMALHKLNRLHLHLSDDQGWRIEIPGWPALTEYGGSTEVGGGPGGYYTREEYADLVAYAADRFIMVIPEIDVPGHTNAALASYAELNCSGEAPPLFTGIVVGFSTLCPEKRITYDFLDDVIREIAALTPGAYFHMGGDEVRELSQERYDGFVRRVQDIVQSHDLRMIGWDEIALADVDGSSLIQLWRPLWRGAGEEELDSASAAAATELREGVMRAISRGAQVILSPADRIYLDLRYERSDVLGLTWAGIPDTKVAYDWAISDLFAGIPEESIAGVEAPLWSETVGTIEDFEYMAFPRLAGVAEIAWSGAAARDWNEYRLRLGAQAARWTALGINYRRSPLVPWMSDPQR